MTTPTKCHERPAKTQISLASLIRVSAVHSTGRTQFVCFFVFCLFFFVFLFFVVFFHADSEDAGLITVFAVRSVGS